jgi:hypothetical protein
MTHAQATGLWIPTALLGVATTGIGIGWRRDAARLRTCRDASSRAQRANQWVLGCFSESIHEGVSKRFFVIAGALTVIAAATTTGVYLYRRKRA